MERLQALPAPRQELSLNPLGPRLRSKKMLHQDGKA
jgi:hypothetical protein